MRSIPRLASQAAGPALPAPPHYEQPSAVLSLAETGCDEQKRVSSPKEVSGLMESWRTLSLSVGHCCCGLCEAQAHQFHSSGLSSARQEVIIDHTNIDLGGVQPYDT